MEIDDETDDRLVRRFVATRDRCAFERLVLRHLQPMRRLIATVLNGDSEEVADAEQEVLVALYRSLGSFAFRSSFRTWLYRFTRNRAIDHLRALRRRRRHEAEVRSRLPVVGLPDPEEIAIRRERAAAMLRSFGKLREADRSIIVLREVEGLAMDEIAGVLGLPAGTVKSRLSRARARLALLLCEQEGRHANT